MLQSSTAGPRGQGFIKHKCSRCHTRVCVKTLLEPHQNVYRTHHPPLSCPGQPAPHFLLFNIPITGGLGKSLGEALPCRASNAALFSPQQRKGEQGERPPVPAPHQGGYFPVPAAPSKGSHPKHPSEGDLLGWMRSRHQGHPCHATAAALTHHRACPGTASRTAG